jgi:DNA-binding MarR family transcriptional regulator
MTSTAPPFDGRDLNLAARATRDVLDALLAQERIDFDQWVTLRTVGLAGEVDTARLRPGIAADLRVSPQAANDLLSWLQSTGLAEQRDGLTVLTPDGRTRFDRLQRAIGAASADLYAGIPLEDLATTARVLREVTDRAAARVGAGAARD